MHTHTRTNTHTPWGTSGKVGDQQKHSRETGEGRGHQMQDSTQQEGERGGGKKVRLRQRQRAKVSLTNSEMDPKIHTQATHKT